MTAQEKNDMRSMFQDMLEISITKHDEQYKLIDYKLDQITLQTTKTNGRVNKLEEKELTHIITCPQNEKIRVLEDNALTNKSIRKWIVASITITAIVVTVLIEFLKLFV